MAVVTEPPWVNQASGNEPRNGTASHTITFPVAPTTGNLLVFIILGSVTHTVSAGGWVERQQPVNSAELSLFEVTAAGHTDITVAHNGADYPVRWVFYELPAGSTYTGSTSATSNTLPGFPALAGLPGTEQVVIAAHGKGVFSSSDPTPPLAAAAWPAPWVEEYDAYGVTVGTDGSWLTVAHQINYTGTTITPTFTPTNGTTGLAPDSQKIVAAYNVAAIVTGPPFDPAIFDPTVFEAGATTPTVAAAAAVLTLTAQPVTLTPGVVTVALQPALLTLAGRPVTPTPGVVTVAAQPALVALAAQPVTPAAQQATVQLAPASLTLQAVPVSPVASGFVNVQPATITLTGQPVTPVPGVVTVQALPASVQLAAQPVTITRVVLLQPASVTLQARPVTVQPGVVTLALAPAVVTLAAQPVQPVAAGALALQPAVVQLTAQPVTPQPQPITVQAVPATMSLSARPVTVQLLPVQLALQAAVLQLAARPVQPQPGLVTVQLQAAQLALAAVAVTVAVATLDPILLEAVGQPGRWQAVGQPADRWTAQGRPGRYAARGHD